MSVIMTGGFRERQGAGVIIWAGIFGRGGIGDWGGPGGGVAAAGRRWSGPGWAGVQGRGRRKAGGGIGG